MPLIVPQEGDALIMWFLRGGCGHEELGGSGEVWIGVGVSKVR